MQAVWYEGFGAAPDVLVLGEMAIPHPGAGEVLVALKASGVNPSDVKLRAGARVGAKMVYPRVVPHSDGAGNIAAVGAGVDPARVGERVWVWNAGWQRAFGTAASHVALPAEQAVRLPDGTSFAEGACFGIPAMTAWYAVMGDGPVAGQTILVTGGAGTVGRYAVQMARLGGARVITTVSSNAKAAHATAEEWVNYRDTDVAEAVLEMTHGAGVDRIVDVDFGANHFYPFMFRNTRLHMLIVYQLGGALRRAGEAQLSAWLEAGVLSHAVVPGGGLADCAAAHDLVAAGDKLGTVVLDI